MNKSMALIAGISLSLCSAALGWAHDPAGGRPASPCQADVDKFCGDVQPGGGRIMKCMEEHEDALSDACKAFQHGKEAGHPQENPEMSSCRGDFEKFCKDVEPGQGRIMGCMKEHERELSDGCRESMSSKIRSEGTKQAGSWGRACGDDAKKFCKDVEPGEGRIVACLKGHASEISDDCAGMLQGKKGGAGMDKPEQTQDDRQDAADDDGSEGGSGE